MERQRIKVVTSRVNISGIHHLFSTNARRITVSLPGGVTVHFAQTIPQPLHHGLRNFAGMIIPHTLSLNSTITFALDLERYGGDYAAFRYTYVERRPRTGRRTREVLIERLGSIGVEGLPPSQVEVNSKRFDQHQFRLGSSWSNQEFEAVLEALARIPDSMLSLVNGLRFNRARGHPRQPGGAYDPLTHTITMHNRAFHESMTRFGTPGQGLSTDAARSIAHEIGHAIDLRPLRHAWDRLGRAEAALRVAFSHYETPPGTGNYRVPNGKQAAWNRLRQQITAAERARDRARSASGYRWRRSSQTGDFEIVPEAAGTAGNAFRRAAEKDGGVRITRYANQEWGEYFAESFSFYIMDPRNLQRLRPNVHAFFVANFPR
ncbi:MAG: hypothetical protein ACE5JN_01840 [Candidatus Methylomirabilia bacterium]